MLTFAAKGPAASDEMGNDLTPFADRFTVSARVVPRLGGEAVIAARLQGQSFANITVRYSPDTIQITTDWKATDVDTGEVWNVRAPPIDIEQRKEWLEMLCEKGIAT